MSSILNYISSLFRSFLTSLGLYQKQGTILLLGLDNAGKTTFLHKLKTANSTTVFAPTEQPRVETFQYDGIKFAGWDLGGHEAVRYLWQDYVCEASAIMFLIDATDHARLQEAGLELDALIHGDNGLDGDDVLSGVPLAIMLNKCDLENAMSNEVIADEICFEELQKSHSGRIKEDQEDYEDLMEEGQYQGRDLIRMYRMSVLRGEGYQDAFRWISTFL
jgi:GTP-binding protein SAR1